MYLDIYILGNTLIRYNLFIVWFAAWKWEFQLWLDLGVIIYPWEMRIDWNKFDAIWPFEPFPMNLLVSGEMFGQAAGFLEHCSPPRARSAIDTFLEKLFTGSLHSSTKYHIFETKCTKFLLLLLWPNACYQVHQVGSKESELSQKSSASLTCTIQKSWCWWF